jgi:hypothetical protein
MYLGLQYALARKGEPYDDQVLMSRSHALSILLPVFQTYLFYRIVHQI